jgi:hypothetical protein
MRVFRSGNNQVALHILGVPPKFVLEPDQYKTQFPVRRLTDSTNLPSELPNTRFAILGVIGMHYDNLPLQQVFLNFRSGIPSSADDDLPSGYAVLTAAVRQYSAQWRGEKPLRIPERKGIVSEKSPRKPRRQPLFERKSRKLGIVGGDIPTAPFIPDNPRSSHNSTEPQDAASSNDASTSSQHAQETEIATPKIEVHAKQVPCSPRAVFTQAPFPSELPSPPWLEPSSRAQEPSTSSSQPVNPPHFSKFPSDFTPPIASTFAGQVKERISGSIQLPPSRIPRPKRRDISPHSARISKRRKIEAQLPNGGFSDHDQLISPQRGRLARRVFRRSGHRGNFNKAQPATFKLKPSSLAQLGGNRDQKSKSLVETRGFNREQTLTTTPTPADSRSFRTQTTAVETAQKKDDEDSVVIVSLKATPFTVSSVPTASREPNRPASQKIQPTPSQAVVHLFRQLQLDPMIKENYDDILRNCPYNLSRLMGITGPLERVTGKELIGMLLLAKQNDRLSCFKALWSRRRVNGVVSEEVIPPVSFTCERTPNMLSHDLPDDVTPSDATRAVSPFTDSSPSPRPHVTRERFLCSKPKFLYYRLSFAGLDLPILGIGYFHPITTKRKICCYGGSSYGERCFLSSWEYETI